jgi:hypothetical protein
MADRMMIRSSPFLAFAVVAAAPAAAAPLTVLAGESWVFSIQRGEPVRARRVKAGARLSAGQIKVTVIAGLGTTMTVINNSRTAYTFRAQPVGAPNAKSRTCTLPANSIPVLEYWPVKAKAVRIGTFRAANPDGKCP